MSPQPGLRIPQESDFEGQRWLITGSPTGTGETDHSRRARQNLVYIRTQGKVAMTSKETEPELPSSVEVWVASGCHGDGDTGSSSPGRCPLV